MKLNQLHRSTIHCEFCSEAAPVALAMKPATSISRHSSAVMVVDDDENMLFLMQVMLQHLGVTEVRCFSDASEALRTFREDPDQIQCVVTDLEMPGLRGTNFCQEIRAIAPGTKVVLATGNELALTNAQVRALGFCAVISKPFHLATLQDVLASAGVAKPLNGRTPEQRFPVSTEGANRFTLN